jgi:hypothetical protein
VPAYRCRKLQVTPLTGFKANPNGEGTSSWVANPMQGDIVISALNVVCEIIGIEGCEFDAKDQSVTFGFDAPTTKLIADAFVGPEAFVTEWAVPEVKEAIDEIKKKDVEFSGKLSWRDFARDSKGKRAVKEQISRIANGLQHDGAVIVDGDGFMCKKLVNKALQVFRNREDVPFTLEWLLERGISYYEKEFAEHKKGIEYGVAVHNDLRLAESSVYDFYKLCGSIALHQPHSKVVEPGALKY